MKRLLPLTVLLFIAAAPSQAKEITRQSVIAAMNDFRAQFHLPPLHEDSRLDAAAEDRMRDMEDLAYWSHESPDGRSPFTWLPLRGYLFEYAGENLAAGFETAELLVSSWMESPGHRENILSPQYTDCGIALLEGATMHRAPGKSVVVLFGRPRPIVEHAARPKDRP